MPKVHEMCVCFLTPLMVSFYFYVIPFRIIPLLERIAVAVERIGATP